MARFDRRLVDHLRRKGLRIREVPGWQTRGKSGFAPKGIICHATAGSRSSTTEGELRVLLNGSNTAPAPIAQFLLARDGEVLVVASGLCYHVGSGWLGNDELIGIEAVNANDGEPYPAVQYAAYVTLVAAICEHYSWPANQVKGHYEVSSTGKTDPRFIPSRVKTGMNEFRAQVAARLSGASADEELDVSAVDAIKQEIYTRYLLTRYGVSSAADASDPTKRQAPCLQSLHEDVTEVKARQAANQAATEAAIKALAEAGGVDGGAIVTAIREATDGAVRQAMAGVLADVVDGPDAQGS